MFTTRTSIPIKNRQKLFWQFWLHQVIDYNLMLNLVPHLWYLDHYWLCTSHLKQIQKLCRQLMQTDSFFGMFWIPSFMSLTLPNLTKFTTMQVYNVYKLFRLRTDVECFNNYFQKRWFLPQKLIAKVWTAVSHKVIACIEWNIPHFKGLRV